MTFATWLVLAAGTVATLGFMVYAGRPESAGWFLGMIPFAVWTLVPYAVLAWRIGRVGESRAAGTTLLVASTVFVAASVWLLFQAFIVEPDAQNALVFVFLPLWQLLAAVAVSAIAGQVGARAHSSLDVDRAVD